MSAPSPHASPNEPVYPTGEPVAPPPRNVLVPRAASRFATLRYAPATYVLLGLNIAVFLYMVWRGVNWQTPSSDALVFFGANKARFVVLGHQWWRLVTATFIHVGIVHLAGNMWCLWNLGLVGEPLLGFWGVISVYLVTGVAGNMLSTLWNCYFGSPFQYGSWDQVGAGASGAVFGIAGILIVLLSNRKLAEPRGNRPGVPLAELVALRRSVIQFAGLNLVIGFATILGGPIRVDNTAHFGGFMCGLAMGLPLLPRMTAGREKYLSRQKVVFAGFTLLLVLVARFISSAFGTVYLHR